MSERFIYSLFIDSANIYASWEPTLTHEFMKNWDTLVNKRDKYLFYMESTLNRKKQKTDDKDEKQI